MRLRELQLQNWLLFREADLSFDKAGNVIGIVGQFTEEHARSNRSGKSSLLEAIQYLFYGKGRDRSQAKLINRSAAEDGGDMVVSGVLEFSDGKTLRVSRGRTHDNKPILDIEDMSGEKVRDATEYLVSRIGFDHDEYLATCFFPQDEIHRFMLATPAEKRALIQSWLNLDRWGRRRETAEAEEKRLAAEGEAIRMALSTLPEISQSIADLTKRLASAERKHRKAQESLDRLRNQLADLRGERAELDAAESGLERAATLRSQMAKTEKSIETAKRLSRVRAKAKSKLARQRETFLSWQEETVLNAATYSAEVSELGRQARKAEKELAERADMRGVCPILDEDCSRVGEASLAALEHNLDEVRGWLSTAKEKLQSYRDQTAKELAGLRRDVAESESKLAKHEYPEPEHFRNLLTQYQEALEGLASDHTEETIRVARAELDRRQGEIRGQIDTAREIASQMAENEAQTRLNLDRARETSGRRKELTDRLKAAEVDRAAWGHCKLMFGPRGIPGAIMEANFKTLETDINFILGRMDTNLSVRFSPYRELKQWEPACTACGWQYESGSRKKSCEECGAPRERRRTDQLVLQVIDEFEGQVSEFGLDSGGGKTLISFAVRLALMFLKVRESTGDIPPVVLDEVLADLDPINRAAVLDLVQNVLVKRYGVQQVFLISHNPEVQESVEDVLLVTRHNYHSEVDWA